MGRKNHVIRHTSQANYGDKRGLEDFCWSLELQIFIIGAWEAQLLLIKKKKKSHVQAGQSKAA